MPALGASIFEQDGTPQSVVIAVAWMSAFKGVERTST
jgi:hypothetical protein